MKRRFEIKVANDVATVQDKRKYASPEIEVVNFDEQPKLLSASATGSGRAGWGDDTLEEESWSE